MNCLSASVKIACPAIGAKPMFASPSRAVQIDRQRLIKANEVSHTTSSTTSDTNPSTSPSPTTIAPAVLPGTPTSFSIPEARLLEIAEYAYSTGSGVKDDSVLADDFRFEFPVVSLDRTAYLKAVRSFGLDHAIPDLNSHPYHWRVDPYEPNRVWFTIRTTGTHTGDLKFGRSTYKATGKTIQGAPECMSYTFNEDGKVTSFTGGYVMDRRVGNTQGLGALFGILAAIGVKIPKPGSLGFTIATAVNRFMTWLGGVFGKKKDE